MGDFAKEEKTPPGASPDRPEGPEGVRMLKRMNQEHQKLRSFGFLNLSFRPGMRILDVGSGGGMTIREMLDLSEGSRIDGLDVSETSVEEGRKTNADFQDRVCIVQGDVSDLPFEPDRYDLVTAVETVYFWPQPVKAFQEILRVLKPGGTFAIMDEGSDPSILELWGPIKGIIYTPKELISMLSEAGFENVQVFHGEEQIITALGRKPELL